MQQLREKLNKKKILKGILTLLGAAVLIVGGYFLAYGITLFFTI